MEQVNLIPFYACAIAFARHIRLDLENEYSKNAVAYYNDSAQKAPPVRKNARGSITSTD